MPSIADTLSRKMKLPPTVRPPANPQFDYQAQPGQFYPGAQDQTDAQLLEAPWRRNMALPGPAPPANFGKLAVSANPMQKQAPLPQPPLTVPDMVAGLKARSQQPAVNPVRQLGEAVNEAFVLGPAENAYEIGAKVTGNRPDMPWTELLGRTGSAALDFGPAAIGKAGLVGGMALNANKAKIAKMRKMTAKGAPIEEAHAETGYWPGVDDKPRTEVIDSGVKLNLPYQGFTGSMPFKEIVQDHPELYAAHPNMANLKVNFKPVTGNYGHYNEQTPEELASMFINSSQSPQEMAKTLWHEGPGHHLQAVEGFNRGSGLKFDEADPFMSKMLDQKIKKIMDVHQMSFGDVVNQMDMKDVEDYIAEMIYKHSPGENEANITMNRAFMPRKFVEENPYFTSSKLTREQQLPYVNVQRPIKDRPPDQPVAARKSGLLTLPNFGLTWEKYKKGKP